MKMGGTNKPKCGRNLRMQIRGGVWGWGIASWFCKKWQHYVHIEAVVNAVAVWTVKDRKWAIVAVRGDVGGIVSAWCFGN